MESSLTSRALVRLCEDEPSYQELVDLYNVLRTKPGETAYEDVAQHALAQVVGEMIDYLDVVGGEFEKAVGLTRRQERERVLSSLSPPDGEDPVERVGDVVRQWRAVERYSRDDLFTAVDESEDESRPPTRLDG